MKILLILSVFQINYPKPILSEITFSKKYVAERQSLIADEIKTAVGGSLLLSPDESAANDILMKYKNTELERVFKDPQKLFFKNNFPNHVQQINNSKVFKIIKQMPKGAAIQLQRVDSFMLNVDDMIEFTYEEHLHVCFFNSTALFHFSIETPDVPCPNDKWLRITDLRGTGKMAVDFDKHLKKFFTLNIYDTDFGEESDIDINEPKFNRVAIPLQSLLRYRPISEKHFYKMLQFFYKDNIRYVELRADMQPVYDVDSLVHNSSYVAAMYKRITEDFITEHPDFIGVRIILTASRDSSIDKLRNTIELYFKLKKEFPDLIAGFDVDGYENRGRSLFEFSRYLLELNSHVNFYFHAGETSWQGTSVDENLVDAIVLNTSRIGNAYALAKHPLLMTLIKEKDIGVEVSVLSNAVHGLVQDLRNHPAAIYLACGLPVVLTSDDPNLWGVDALSHDFYATFIAVASRHADLRLLKQLAINSIQYSSLDIKTKMKFLQKFYSNWSEFVKFIVRNYRELDIDDKI